MKAAAFRQFPEICCFLGDCCYISCYILSMASAHFQPVRNQPYLFRRNGIYYFRRAVPKEARPAFDQAEVQRSLRTTSLSVARLRWAEALKQFEERLVETTARTQPTKPASLSPRTPSRDDIEVAAREWLSEKMERATLQDLGSSGALSSVELNVLELDTRLADIRSGTAMGSARPSLMTTWVADHLIERNGWHIPEGSNLERHLLTIIGRGQAEAIRRQHQDIMGEPRVVVDHTFHPEQYRLDVERARERASSGPVTLWQLFDGYSAESRPAPATAKAWKRFISAFIDFLGTDDATRVSFPDMIRWKEHLLAKPTRRGGTLSPKTVRDTYLAAVKTVFNWGMENNRLPSNPTALVRVRSARKVRLRDPDFTEAEAISILRATLTTPPAGLSVERARARRWVPWLCAYSGARVTEITQMRSQDVVRIGEVWAMRITPEAGSTKNQKARVIALHPHILEQGFLEAIEGISGPLFYNSSLRREGSSDAHPQSKKVGQHLADWVRNDVGINDLHVAPNHGWRHRFKTVARTVGMDPETRDYIQGHVPRTEGETYGGIAPEVTLREISKLPAYRIGSLIR